MGQSWEFEMDWEFRLEVRMEQSSEYWMENLMEPHLWMVEGMEHNSVVPKGKSIVTNLDIPRELKREQDLGFQMAGQSGHDAWNFGRAAKLCGIELGVLGLEAQMEQSSEVWMANLDGAALVDDGMEGT
eukprot:scaffold303805_cov24-Attheya_sp.AAC.2